MPGCQPFSRFDDELDPRRHAAIAAGLDPLDTVAVLERHAVRVGRTLGSADGWRSTLSSLGRTKSTTTLRERPQLPRLRASGPAELRMLAMAAHVVGGAGVNIDRVLAKGRIPVPG